MGAMFVSRTGGRGERGARAVVCVARRRGVCERSEKAKRRGATSDVNFVSNGRRPAGHLDGARGWMPAIWRPNVSRVPPMMDVEVRGDGGRVEQGDEAEEGP